MMLEVHPKAETRVAIPCQTSEDLLISGAQITEEDQSSGDHTTPVVLNVVEVPQMTVGVHPIPGQVNVVIMTHAIHVDKIMGLILGAIALAHLVHRTVQGLRIDSLVLDNRLSGTNPVSHLVHPVTFPHRRRQVVTLLDLMLPPKIKKRLL